MGNIKHNDELLRINDDGFDVVFNCDNKHQNGVSYHAEKNGKKTKIDPEYAMAALVKKVSGDMIVVKITYNEDDDTFSCNRTYDEIVEAFPNIIFVDDFDGIGYFCCLVNDGIDDGFHASIIGTSVDTAEKTISSIFKIEYIIRPDNTVEVIEYSAT